jgi:hypothetical protein
MEVVLPDELVFFTRLFWYIFLLLVAMVGVMKLFFDLREWIITKEKQFNVYLTILLHLTLFAFMLVIAFNIGNIIFEHFDVNK